MTPTRSRRLLTSAIAALLLGVMVTPGAAGAGAPGLATDSAAGPDGFTVMTQNLYLGADVAGALELLPDVPAAAQDLWSQVTVTDFSSRVPALAREVAAVNPAVIGLQEATTWSCTPDATTEPVAVYDFTAEYLAATSAGGPGYVVAPRGGQQALSPGYAIAPIVGATPVEDPDTFQPLFGTDSASCGFGIADALLVRADLAERVTAVGIRTYDATLDIIPGFITIQRGCAWADVDLDGTVVPTVGPWCHGLRVASSWALSPSWWWRWCVGAARTDQFRDRGVVIGWAERSLVRRRRRLPSVVASPG